MELAIKNDPIGLTAIAFKRLHPELKYEAYYESGLKDSEGNTVWGQTLFPNDGTTPIIIISLELFQTEGGIVNVTEVFAHELSHVVAGETEQHSALWDAEFESILNEYTKVCLELDFVEVLG